MEGIKDIYEAFLQRIRSPIFGYVVIYFVALNWKEITILLFSKAEIDVRVLQFKSGTDLISLFVLPLALGVFLAFLAPWVTLIGAIWAEYPVMKRRTRAVRAASELTRLREGLRARVNEEVATLIDAAKQDEEVKSISDPELRRDVQNQIDELRKQVLVPASDERSSTKTEPELLRIRLLENEADVYKQRGDLDRAAMLLEEAQHLLREVEGQK